MSDYPLYQSIFVDFDYDYIKLGEQLGESWTDQTWKNDTNPKFSKLMDVDSDTWYDVWFDYKDPTLSEHLDNRAVGEMHQFMLCDEFGHVIFSTNNWEEMKKAIVEDKVDENHFDNEQEKRATDTDG
jgi:hypothetical protein